MQPLLCLKRGILAFQQDLLDRGVSPIKRDGSEMESRGTIKVRPKSNLQSGSFLSFGI